MQKGFGSRQPLVRLAALEFLLVVAAASAGLVVSWAEADNLVLTIARYWPQISMFTLAVFLTFYACGLYDWKHASNYADSVARVSVALFLAFLGLASVFYMLPDVKIYRSAMAVGLPLVFFVILMTRAIFVSRVNSGAIRTRILVIGVGEHAAKLLELERATKARRYEFVAFIDFGNEPTCVDETQVLAPPDDWKSLVERLGVDEIVVAVRERRGLPLRSLIECRLAGVLVTPYQVFCERELGHIDLNALRPDWFLSEGFVSGRWQRAVKRLLDIVGSVVLLVLSLPVMLATALAIKIESSGSVFYRQERMGLHGRTFRVAKFRSMYADAEKDGIPRWATEGDPRVTLIGRFIRAFRIDEIPQVLNVLKGEMSLVGPRPERPYFVHDISRSIAFYGERHHVKPGITGWAQLNYHYGSSISDAERKLEYDLFYIKYFSIILDLQIIAQTLRVILWRSGAR